MAKHLATKTLKKAAKDLNRFIEKEDRINLKLGVGELEDKILEASQVIEPEDDLEETTLTVLRSLGWDGWSEEPEEPEEPGEESEEPGEEPLDDLSARVMVTKRLGDLKELVDNHNEFKKLKKSLDNYKGLQGTRELKNKMLELLGVDLNKLNQEKVKTKGKGTRKEKKQKSVENTRVGIIGIVMNKNKGKALTRKEISNQVDEIMKEKGLTPFEKENLRRLSQIMQFAETFGIAKSIDKETVEIYE